MAIKAKMLPKPTNIAFRVCPSRYKALAALANQMDITRYTMVEIN